MVAYVIGLLMALGFITSSEEFNSLPQNAQQHYMDWTGEEEGGGI